MFSLCIPTMDRYDDYLKNNLPKYIENELIDEIIISDENGNDINKIKEFIGEHDKFKFNINKIRQGPFMNKITACKMAKNNWIALIDSDNFADYDYFFKMSNFIKSNELSGNTILSPDYANEIFQWKYLSYENNLLNKETYSKIKDIDDKHVSSHTNVGCLSHLMNVGNFVINKKIITDIKLNEYQDIIKKSFSFDVVLFLLICFEQLNLNFYLVKDCSYIHASSKDSIYITFAQYCKINAEKTYDKIWKVLSDNNI